MHDHIQKTRNGIGGHARRQADAGGVEEDLVPQRGELLADDWPVRWSHRASEIPCRAISNVKLNHIMGNTG